MKKLFTIKEVADIMQISKRTLHYYHEIELVIPNHIDDNSYRLYDLDNIRKLQTVVFLKEVGLSLEQIATYFEADVHQKNKILKSSYNNVVKQRDKLSNMINFLDNHLKKSLNQELMPENIGDFNVEEQYAREARSKYEDTTYFQSFSQQRKELDKDEKVSNHQQVKMQFDTFFDEVNALVLKGKNTAEIARIIPKLQTILTQQVPNCDNQFLICIAQTYENDERFQQNINKNRVANLHEYIVEAIKYYVNKSEK